MDYMYAGYILSNPVVREQYKEAEKLGIYNYFHDSEKRIMDFF